jgi:hypothetical protein
MFSATGGVLIDRYHVLRQDHFEVCGFDSSALWDHVYSLFPEFFIGVVHAIQALSATRPCLRPGTS